MIVDPAALSGSLRRVIAREHPTSADEDLRAALSDVVAACVDLFGVTGSGIMLADDVNMMRSFTASDTQGRRIEKVEAETMEGPCTDAFVLDRAVSTPDVESEGRWPAFRAAVAKEPEVRAILGVPVKLGAVPVGTLDVFLDRPHQWTEAEQGTLMRFSAVVEAALSSAVAAHAAGEQAEQLRYALDHRIVIERAVGFLMAREQLDAVTAFNRLRAAARERRTKISRVAQEILDKG